MVLCQSRGTEESRKQNAEQKIHHHHTEGRNALGRKASECLTEVWFVFDVGWELNGHPWKNFYLAASRQLNRVIWLCHTVCDGSPSNR